MTWSPRLATFNFLASLINGNISPRVASPRVPPTFNFLASLINGNYRSSCREPNQSFFF